MHIVIDEVATFDTLEAARAHIRIWLIKQEQYRIDTEERKRVRKSRKISYIGYP